MNSPEIYTDRYYNKIHDLEMHHWWHLGMREIAASLIKSITRDWTPQRSLDVGCGTGRNVVWTQEALGAREALGVDIAFHGLELGRAAGVLPLAQASAMSLPFGSDSFDFVLCEDVLQHLPVGTGELAVLQEIRRVLKEEGWILVRANSRLGFGQKGLKKDHDYQRYTTKDLAERMSEAGFEIRRLTYANCLPSLYAMMKERLTFASGNHGSAHDESHGHVSHEKVYSGHGVRNTAAEAPKLNRLLRLIMSAEARYLSAPDRSLPFGHTTFCLAQQPKQ